LDTVSRQSFGDIQETQFSGNKMEVNVHLKNAFQAELETEGSRLATIFGLPPTPQQDQFSDLFFSNRHSIRSIYSYVERIL